LLPLPLPKDNAATHRLGRFGDPDGLSINRATISSANHPFKPENTSETERKAIRILAHRFHWNPGGGTSYARLAAELCITTESLRPVIVRLRSWGALRPEGSPGELFVSPFVADLGAEVERFEKQRAEPKDVIDSIKIAIRRKPIAAVSLLAFIAAAALFHLINTVLELCIKFGWIKPPKT
jgi:hypothetical protein